MEFKLKNLLELSTNIVLHIQFEISEMCAKMKEKERRMIIQSHFNNGKSAKETVLLSSIMEFLGRVSTKLCENLRKDLERIEKKDLGEKLFENQKSTNSRQKKVGEESEAVSSEDDP